MASPIAEALSTPFIWGRGGARMTPEQIAREREIAEALGVVDTSPVGHWTQGAARMANALVGRIKEGRASSAEAQNATANQDIVASLLGGGGSTFPPAPVAGGAASLSAPSIPQTAEASAIREGLVSRGLPPHVADAFVLNFQDESGLNPGINERNPIVPGSRGGFGLYQLTGPRRTAYEQFAGQRGVDPSDVDAQLDWLMHELQGPEAKAAQSILSAGDTGTAAAAIVNDFLRPSPEHRTSRANRYMSLAGQDGQAPAAQALDSLAGGQPVQVASLDPSIGMEQAAPAPEPNMQVAQALAGPDLSQIPVTAGGNAGVAQPGQSQSINPAIIQALSSPYVNDQTRQIAGMLLGNQMQQQQAQQAADMERQQRMQAAQAAGINPAFAADPEVWKQATAAQFRDPATATVGNSIIDTRTGQPIYQGQPDQPTSVQEYEFYRQQAGENAMPYGDWDMARRKSGATNISNVVGGEGDAYQKKFWETMAGADAKSFTDAIETGDQARRNRINLDRLSQLAGSTPQGFEGAMTRALGEYGIKTEGLDKVQAMESLISQLVPTQRPPGSGTISDADLALYKASLPRLINTPEGNRLILDTMYAINDHDIAASEIAARVASGELKPADARKELRQLPNPFDNWRDQVDAIEGGSASGGTPKAGEIIDGYRFKGGDPADPNSWERQ